MARLRAIAATLLEDDPDGAGAWFNAALQQFQAAARHGLTLEQAFGLQCGPGERPWWHSEALEQRDEILRRLAAAHFPTLGTRPAAAAISRALARYEGGRWRRDKDFMAPPEGVAGELFRLLKLGVPLSEGTIRRALSVGSQDIPIRAPRTA